MFLPPVTTVHVFLVLAVCLVDLYWLKAPICQCYLLQAIPFFDPRNLDVVHRAAFAEPYIGGVLKHC